MKPIKLVVEALKNSSHENDIVLDTFAGSGSTLIACEQSGRRGYSMELDPRYADVIRKRYAKFINKEEIWQEVTPEIK
jgi:site-specific DNA-methyltransferase (adenine-specific)